MAETSIEAINKERAPIPNIHEQVDRVVGEKYQQWIELMGKMVDDMASTRQQLHQAVPGCDADARTGSLEIAENLAGRIEDCLNHGLCLVYPERFQADASATSQ